MNELQTCSSTPGDIGQERLLDVEDALLVGVDSRSA